MKTHFQSFHKACEACSKLVSAWTLFVYYVWSPKSGVAIALTLVPVLKFYPLSTVIFPMVSRSISVTFKRYCLNIACLHNWPNRSFFREVFFYHWKHILKNVKNYQAGGGVGGVTSHTFTNLVSKNRVCVCWEIYRWNW